MMKLKDLKAVAAAANAVNKAVCALSQSWPDGEDLPFDVQRAYPFELSLEDATWKTGQFAHAAAAAATAADVAEAKLVGAVRTILYQRFKVVFYTEAEVAEAVKALRIEEDDDPDHIAHAYAHAYAGARLSLKFKSGDRVRMSRPRDICRSLVGEDGDTGVVVANTGTMFAVEMDNHFECLDEWDNQITWVDADLLHNDGPDRYLEAAPETALTDFACPKCGGHSITALSTQFIMFAVVGVRDGKVITDDSAGSCDHPDQDTQRFNCDDCNHQWVDAKVKVDWCVSFAHDFLEEEIVRAQERLAKAVQRQSDPDTSTNDARWKAVRVRETADTLAQLLKKKDGK